MVNHNDLNILFNKMIFHNKVINNNNLIYFINLSNK